MKNKAFKASLLVILPVAVVTTTIGVSYALWKYSTIVEKAPESAIYQVEFYNEANTTNPYLTYSELEYDSGFELPQNLPAFNGHAFNGWSKASNGALIANIYNKYSDLVDSTSTTTLRLYAVYAS